MNFLGSIIIALMLSINLWGSLEDVLTPIWQECIEPCEGQRASFSGLNEAPQPHTPPLAAHQDLSAGSEHPLVNVCISVDDIEYALTQKLSHYYQVEGALHVKCAYPWSPHTLKHSDWSLEILDRLPHELSSRLWVRYQILCGGEIIGQWRMPISCELWQNVYIVPQRIARHSPLQYEAFTVRSMDVLSMQQLPVCAKTSLAGYQSAHTLAAGQPLTWHDLSRKPDIPKGKIVEVIANEGFLTIRMKGKAMQDGDVGEFIAVTNPNTGKDFQAKVINEDTVQVYF